MNGDDFGELSDQYASYSGSVRGRLRHDIVMWGITTHCNPPGRALDVGCGDGEVSIRLAALGWSVDGFDPSEEMIQRAKRRVPADRAGAVQFSVASLEEWAGNVRYDLVCCHGVLMYLPSSVPAIERLASWVKPGGHLSVLTKNGSAVGFREGLKQQYDVAIRLIERGALASPGNLGVQTRGDTVPTLVRYLRDAGLRVADWYGVRIFHDHIPPDRVISEDDYRSALALEWVAAVRSPFRDVAPLVHLMAVSGERSPDDQQSSCDERPGRPVEFERTSNSLAGLG